MPNSFTGTRKVRGPFSGMTFTPDGARVHERPERLMQASGKCELCSGYKDLSVAAIRQ